MKILSTFLKRIAYTLFALILLLNLVIVVTGRFYLYKAIANTYLLGRSGPNIDEYQIFANRTVAAGKPQPWPVATNYNKKTISQNYLNEIKHYQTAAFLIIKNDSLCYEQYWDGYSDTSHTNSFSMGKSITSILVGIAIEEGKIKSVDEFVSDFIPQFKQGMDSLLTIKDLLTMSSGMDFDESYVSPFAYPAQAYYGSELMEMTLKYKVITTPGKEFKYLSGNSTLLGYIVTKATGKTLADYASEKLWQPLGAEYPAYWSLDHEGGMEKSYCCFNSNARDFARIGQLYLDTGKWIDKDHIEPFVDDTIIGNRALGKFYKQIVPKYYVIASTTPKLVNYYGYNWWLLRCNGHYVPYCRGILGQYIFVIPDLKMVVVRLGKKRGPVVDNVPTDGLMYLKAAFEMYGK